MIQTDANGLAVHRATAAGTSYVAFASLDGKVAVRRELEDGAEILLELEPRRPLEFQVRNEDGDIPSSFRVSFETRPPGMAPPVVSTVTRGTVTCLPFSHSAYEMSIWTRGKRVRIAPAHAARDGSVRIPD